MDNKEASLKEIINIVKDAVSKEAYSAAFFCALSLPDICSQIEYKRKQGEKKYYIKWYDEFIFKYEVPNYDDDKWDNMRNIDKLDGEFIYLLRCKLFHEGELYHKELDKLIRNKFQKEYEDKKINLEFDLNAEFDSFGYYDSSWKPDEITIRIRLNQKNLTNKLIWTSEGLIRKRRGLDNN
ncbi:hypothetical protein BAU15_01500 [Enterococcus sp. JM4C]|uniref:hypothetical protein n=1 Tax=Candidatus Enterococcus huntleyi TaxID=1857217 RepID=UPI0013798D02|nr:hypothetical protein [Enterococcus sp. JM4C]KAF1299348.1 hypothetical protein BAU15_01500 [Enterococcus sp. JM4C]